jgi:putative glycosyltransferase (TIGR04348 family)
MAPARPPRPTRPLITIVTPSLAAANNGNWQTAARWARMLRGPYRVRIVTTWQAGDAPPALLIALHARRSAQSIAAFAAAHPQRPLIVALTGTDLYRDIAIDAAARRSLQLATRLIVLNSLGARQLPPQLRAKAAVVVQSAPPRGVVPKARQFTIAVVGHLRDEKNPQLVWRVIEGWPAAVPLRVLHAGRALDPALGRQARRVARRDARYTWLGDQPRGHVRRRVAAAHVLLHPSAMEGGALAVIEAVTAHTPVIGSRIDGNVGLLGARYPGWFAPDDADAARALLLRAATQPRFLARLARQCDRRADFFAPAREQRDLRRVVAGCLTAGALQTARSPTPRRRR